MVAIKQVSLKGICDKDLSAIMAEVNLLKRLDHPNIVKYLGVIRTPDHLNFILEYAIRSLGLYGYRVSSVLIALNSIDFDFLVSCACVCVPVGVQICRRRIVIVCCQKVWRGPRGACRAICCSNSPRTRLSPSPWCNSPRHQMVRYGISVFPCSIEPSIQSLADSLTHLRLARIIW